MRGDLEIEKFTLETVKFIGVRLMREPLTRLPPCISANLALQHRAWDSSAPQ